MKVELDFDKFVKDFSVKVPVIGAPFLKQYKRRPWLRRFTKFGVSTFIVYWLVKGPLLWALTLSLPSINLVLFAIPSYVLAGFFAGIIVTVLGFVINEVWVWKPKRRKKKQPPKQPQE